MEHFIKPLDGLSELINAQAQLLYAKLSDLPIMELGLPEVPLNYYLGRHHERKFFSVQTAAELLYRSIKLKNKKPGELVIMDYGAGLGSLFLLAKMIGCKTVIYNDILEDMNTAARIISDYLEVPVDYFISGDHQATIHTLNNHNLQCDIILSRNVVEHIYDLDSFYADMAREQPDALLYFSTTANIRNPAMFLYHKKVHYAGEKEFRGVREQLIKERIKGITPGQLTLLADKTKGLALDDFENAIMDYRANGRLPDPGRHGSNTCHPETGSWAEHLLPFSAYKSIIEAQGYTLTIKPAFWDTHSDSSLKNIIGKTMNFAGRNFGTNIALATTAFIYISSIIFHPEKVRVIFIMVSWGVLQHKDAFGMQQLFFEDDIRNAVYL
jgi:hypothetical protein